LVGSNRLASASRGLAIDNSVWKFGAAHVVSLVLRLVIPSFLNACVIVANARLSAGRFCESAQADSREPSVFGQAFGGCFGARGRDPVRLTSPDDREWFDQPLIDKGGERAVDAWRTRRQ
jgi:hypothetical protein